MKRLRFYKEIDQWFGERWYVHLPEWTGGKDALEMVSGADTMLDYMAEGNNEVILNISEDSFENSDEARFVKMADDIGEGAYYRIEKYRGIEIGLDIWLCDVMLFVFNDRFPERIFISTN